jgi:hypothetical protein
VGGGRALPCVNFKILSISLLMMHDPTKIKIGVARVPLSMDNGSTTIANYYFLIVGFSRIMEH